MPSSIEPTTIEILTHSPGYTVTLTKGDVARIFYLLDKERNDDGHYSQSHRIMTITGTGETIGEALDRLRELFTTGTHLEDLEP